METGKKVKIEELDQVDYIDDEYIYEVGEKYAREIGEFLIIFSRLEHELNKTIAESFCDDVYDIGYQIIDSLNIFNKIELLYKRCSLQIYNTNKEKKSKLKLLKEKLNEINSFRNHIVHANWMTLRKDKYVRVKMKTNDDGLIKFEYKKMTLTLIREKILECESLTEELSEFLNFISE